MNKVKLATVVEVDSKGSFFSRRAPLFFPRLLYFTLNPYLIMLTVKQESIKYHVLSLWYAYLPTPPLGQDMTRSQFLSGV